MAKKGKKTSSSKKKGKTKRRTLPCMVCGKETPVGEDTDRVKCDACMRKALKKKARKAAKAKSAGQNLEVTPEIKRLLKEKDLANKSGKKGLARKIRKRLRTLGYYVSQSKDYKAFGGKTGRKKKKADTVDETEVEPEEEELDALEVEDEELDNLVEDEDE